MTANMSKGKGFRGALRYNLEKVQKGVAEVLDHSFVDVSEKIIMREVQMIKVLRPNLQKFFYHTSINFPPKENLTNAAMLQIGQDYLKESGFNQHQYIMFRHHDANHPHLHILVNRIGYDGKVLSDSNDFARCEKILRQLEMKYNLRQVTPSNQAKIRAITKDELEMMKRTSIPSYKVQLQEIIKDTLCSKRKLSCLEFIEKLERKGVNILFNQASTGYVSGISYSYAGLTVTGAKLGNDFKWGSIKSSIDYSQERDCAIIQQANSRTKAININLGIAAEVHPMQNRNVKQEFLSGQEDNPESNSIKEKSKGRDFLSRQKDHVLDKLVQADDQAVLDPQSVLNLKKKKKRKKGLRR